MCHLKKGNLLIVGWLQNFLFDSVCHFVSAALASASYAKRPIRKATHGHSPGRRRL